MMFTWKTADLRDPWQSEIVRMRLEDALDCDGMCCGTAICDPDLPAELAGQIGATVSTMGMHWHMVVSGENPEASPRHIAVR